MLDYVVFHNVLKLFAVRFTFAAIIFMAAVSIGFAQDTLKAKYQTNDVVISKRKLSFVPYELFVVENGPVLVEKGSEYFRLKDVQKNEFLYISDTVNWQVWGGKFLVIEKEDSVFQVLNERLNFVGKKPEVLPYYYAFAFYKDLLVMLRKHNSFGSYFSVYNKEFRYFNNYLLFDAKNVTAYLQRMEYFGGAKGEGYHYELEKQFTLNMVAPPRPIGAFEKDGALRVISVAQETIFYIDSTGAISNTAKLKGCIKLPKKLRLINDPVTNKVYAISKSFKTQLYLIDEENLSVKKISEIDKVDNENCGVYNGVFYYLKAEIPYGKSVQQIKID